MERSQRRTLEQLQFTTLDVIGNSHILEHRGQTEVNELFPVVLEPSICKGEDTHISEMCFQIALTSEHVAGLGGVPFSELRRYQAKKRKLENVAINDVLPLKPPDAMPLLTFKGFGGPGTPAA